MISVKGFFWFIFSKKFVFETVNTNLWQSERPVKVVAVFWNAKGLLVKKRIMVLGVPAFLKQVLSLTRFSRSFGKEKCPKHCLILLR